MILSFDPIFEQCLKMRNNDHREAMALYLYYHTGLEGETPPEFYSMADSVLRMLEIQKNCYEIQIKKLQNPLNQYPFLDNKSSVDIVGEYMLTRLNLEL